MLTKVKSEPGQLQIIFGIYCIVVLNSCIVKAHISSSLLANF